MNWKRIALSLAGVAAILAVGVFMVVGMLDAGNSTPVVSGTAPLPPVVAEPTESVPVEVPPAETTEPVVPAAPVPVEPPPATTPPNTNLGVVTIDAGHQAKADTSTEPIGPGASEKKPKVAGGTRGVSSRTPESQVNLEVALKLQKELESRGVKVVMVRTAEDVNVSNSARAKIANDAKSDLFVRLHCDGAESSANHGISTLIPASNQWTGPIVKPSGVAGRLVHAAVVRATGAKDNGVVTRSDLSGFNWATVPTVLVEMGFMTNSDEDRRLNDDAYQQKLATGMADGVVEYLKSN